MDWPARDGGDCISKDALGARRSGDQKRQLLTGAAMARIRYIKPEFFEDTDMAEISFEGRLLYIGLWCWMDRAGLTENNARLIKRNVFPYDAAISVPRVEELLAELVTRRRLFVVEWEGKSYLYCPTFPEHQKPHPGEKPKYRIPQQTLLATVRPLAEQCSDHDRDGSKHAGTGTGTGTGTGIGIETGTGKGTGTFTGTLTETGTVTADAAAQDKDQGEFHSSGNRDREQAGRGTLSPALRAIQDRIDAAKRMQGSNSTWSKP